MMKIYQTAYHNIIPHMQKHELKPIKDRMMDDFDKGDFYGSAYEFATIILMALP